MKLLVLKRTIFCIVIFSFIGCKSHYETHPVKVMYAAKYENQRVMYYPLLENRKDVFDLTITYLKINYSDLKVNFDIYESINATLVNKNDIWKVKLIRNEVENGKIFPAHYYCYIRKEDGALLYIRREAGEWIGSTDIEEGFFKSN